MPWRAERRRQAVTLAALAALLAAGCASGGAVGLAYCIEEAAKSLRRAPAERQVRRDCRLGLAVPARVVAFPSGPVSRADLRQVGLSDAEVDRVSYLQIGGPVERLNVLPAARRPRPSRTTYHRRFVETPELLACWANAGRVTVVVERAGDRLRLVGLE